MSVEQQWPIIRMAFDALVDASPAERAAAVAAHPELDAEGKAALLQMLAAAPGDDTLTDAPRLMRDLDFGDAIVSSAPDAIGDWQVLRELGEGGMGTVYLVERVQHDVRQLAALKLLKGVAVNQLSIARFRSEQRMLAGLNHPNIAHLIESGLDARGAPYLAMEYVEGESLLTYAELHQLDGAARLALIQQICAAVDHAHQRLIVHRDLKPNNILVDQNGRAKLLDFGIGKLLSELDGATVLTQTGMRMFTLGYAAPEQLNGEEISTATDVFSLGVMIYQLLTLRLPYEVASNRAIDWERQVFKTQPVPPSVVRRQLTGSERTTQSERVPMPRAWATDLDAIVLKALRPEPSERYSSVAQLSADLTALREGRPVSARRGNWRYRSAKFLRRHALVAGLVCVSAAAIIAGGGAALWQAQQAQLERDQALSETRRANAVVDFMTQVFAAADPGSQDGKTPSAKELLDRGRDDIHQHKGLDLATKVSLSLAIARAYRAVGATDETLAMMQKILPLAESANDPKLLVDTLTQLAISLKNAKREREALPILAQAEQNLAGTGLNDEARQARIDIAAATILINLNRAKDALPKMKRAYDAFYRLDGPLSVDLVDLLSPYAMTLAAVGREADAVKITSPSYLAAQRDPELTGTLRRSILAAHAVAMHFQNDAKAAEPVFREALALDEKLYGRDTINTRWSLNNLAVCLSRQDRFLEASQLMDRALAIPDPGTAPSVTARHFNAAEYAFRAGHLQRAREVVDQVRNTFVLMGNPLSRMRLNFALLEAEISIIEGNRQVARELLDSVSPHLENNDLTDDKSRERFARLTVMLKSP